MFSIKNLQKETNCSRMMGSWVSVIAFSFEVVMIVMFGLIFQIADQCILS